MRFKVRVLLVFNTTCVLLLANSVWCVGGSILILQLFVNISILICLPAYGFSSFVRWVVLNRDSFDFYISTDFEEIIWSMIQVSDVSKKSCWFLLCPLYFVIRLEVTASKLFKHWSSKQKSLMIFKRIKRPWVQNILEPLL